MVEFRGNRDELNLLLLWKNLWRNMHNLIPHSQLDGWQHNHYQSHNDMLDDYYECLIECDTKQNECKRICREILQ